MITGITANTKKHLQLDSGAIFKNYDITTDTPATASSKLLGATVSGASISFTPEVRLIEVDGIKAPTKGFEVIDSWTATLSANVKEITPDILKIALGSATISSPTAPTGYKKIVANPNVADADYLDNITWVGRMLGSDKPIVIVLKNALCVNGFEFTVADKSEGNIPLVMTAHYSVTDLDEVPFEIYEPVFD